MKTIALIFAGGVGSRMGSKTPKQFLEIYGKPIIIHTLEKFQYNKNIDEIYVGCKKEYIGYLKELISKYSITKINNNNIIEGGNSGLDTIYRVLNLAKNYNDDAIVLIHDGVRPNINDSIIDKNIESVKKYGNAITCVPSFETPIYSDDGIFIKEVLTRNNVFVAKAPQSFKLNEILNAYNKVLAQNKSFDGFVDSCSIALNSNFK